MTILALDRVSKSFGALTVADDDLVRASSEGEALGIIGPNGAGKSTLFNLITGNIAADSGSIRFVGRDVTQHAADAALPRRASGRTFQIPQPFEQADGVREPAGRGAFGAAADRGARSTERCAEILERDRPDRQGQHRRPAA